MVAALAGMATTEGRTVSSKTSSDKAGSKREAIRRKVEASQASMSPAKCARSEPPEGMRALAMDYPFAMLAGSVVVGAMIGALLPRSAASKLTRHAIAAAGVAAELGMAYGRQALDKAGETAGKLEDMRGDLGGKLSDGASDLSSKAADLFGDAAELIGEAGRMAGEAMQDAAESARQAGLKIGRQSIRLRSHLRH